MTAHKHAALMLQYAQDAMETDKPWERWEVKVAADVQPNVMFQGMSFHPEWYVCNEYRRKPQPIKVSVNGKNIEFPEPVKIAPPDGTPYWMPAQRSSFGFNVQKYIWEGDDSDFGALNHGLIHLSPEAAQAHADALNAVCKGGL